MASPTPEDIALCIRVLDGLVEDRAALADLAEDTRRTLLTLAGRLSRPTRAEQRDLAKAFRRKDRLDVRSQDEAVLEATGVRSLRRESVFPTPLLPSTTSAVSETRLPTPADDLGPELNTPRKCYVCKAEFRRVHFFYDQMCADCARFNWQKRNASTPLDGRVALITGGRVKIGYHAAIKLLRAGARVIVTTRFPRDGASRFAREPDFESFRERLEVWGLDLMHTPSVERFAELLTEHLDRLDFVIHNACQTVRRPPAYYQHRMEAELASADTLSPKERALVASWEAARQGSVGQEGSVALLLSSPERAEMGAIGLSAPQAFTQMEHAFEQNERLAELFPEGRLDADLQQVDLRSKNSWRLTLAEVPTVELLEVHLVNAVAPFVLNARLRPLMTRQVTHDKHIVNVSAMEGQFNRPYKTDKHPHTNMAKAALTMMTRTSAPDYARVGIFMNSVDTGWITDEDPVALAEQKRAEHGFHPPLDVVDGAARIVDPIFHGIATGEHYCGLFLKDYRSVPW